jgi:hypothetical protein
MSLRRAFFAGLLSQQVTPLVQQFIHDSRKDVIRYSGTWLYFTNLGGAPYRNADTTVVRKNTAVATIEFAFTAGGQADEWIRLYAPQSNETRSLIYLNDTKLLDKTGSGGAFYEGGDLYANPWFVLKPVIGLNRLRIEVQPGANNDLYFDGIGLNVRGGPQPI